MRRHRRLHEAPRGPGRPERPCRPTGPRPGRHAVLAPVSPRRPGVRGEPGTQRHLRRRRSRDPSPRHGESGDRHGHRARTCRHRRQECGATHALRPVLRDGPARGRCPCRHPRSIGPPGLDVHDLELRGPRSRRRHPDHQLPEAAILGVGSIRPRPHVVDGAVVARPTAALTLAFDHRVCDGVEAGRFLGRLRELVEAPDLALLLA